MEKCQDPRHIKAKLYLSFATTLCVTPVLYVLSRSDAIGGFYNLKGTPSKR